jgi:hypothetical protein
MRHASASLGLVLSLTLAVGHAMASGVPIDPVPGSPLLGELLAREAAILETPSAKAAPASRPAVRAVPHVPKGATTVLVPGGRLR